MKISQTHAPNGQPWPARLAWEGACNQCGQCCTIPAKLNGQEIKLTCEYLRVYLVANKPMRIGEPRASKCSVYEQRVNGMKIRMLDPQGVARAEGVCTKDHWLEDQQILTLGLGKGCSLKLGNPADVPIGQFIHKGVTP